jgi:hypothetical protein
MSEAGSQVVKRNVPDKVFAIKAFSALCENIRMPPLQAKGIDGFVYSHV